MYAAEIDARKALRRWLATRQHALEQVALRGTWLDEEDVSKLLRLSLPGIDEVAALLEIARFGSDKRFDLVVVDTAPTGHTLRMLTMPETLRRVAAAFDRMQAKHRVLARALTGTYVADETDALIAEIDRDGAALASLLRDRAMTRVSWVTLPEDMAVEETAAAAAALAINDIPLRTVIVNRLTALPPDRCRWCEGRRVIEARAVRHLRSRLPRVAAVEVTARTVEPRGTRMLKAIGTEIERGRRKSSAAGSFRVPGASAARAVRPAQVSSLGRRARPVNLSITPSTRLALFGGKGGVGKSTCAAAAALRLAEEASHSVLLLSTDPAHSLAHVLGQPVGDMDRRLRRGPPNLKVREIDAARELDRIRARYTHSVDALFDRITRRRSSAVDLDATHDREAMHGLIELAPPGIDELAAVIDVVDAIQADAVQTIVLDTAPTGHALRLLEMPELVHDWTKALMSILLKYQPVAGIGEFGPALLKLSQGLGRLRHLLTNPIQTSFIVVTRGAALPREETLDLLRSLDRLGVHVPAVVVNAAGRGTCRRCRAEARVEQQHIRGLKRQIPRDASMLIAPAELPPPHGPAQLRQWQQRWMILGREKGKGKAPAARARREVAERERAGVGPRER